MFDRLANLALSLTELYLLGVVFSAAVFLLLAEPSSIDLLGTIHAAMFWPVTWVLILLTLLQSPP